MRVMMTAVMMVALACTSVAERPCALAGPNTLMNKAETAQPHFDLAAQNATQQPAQAPAPKKKPEEPIDPDSTAGVRGPGGMHTVRVLRKGKPVEGAHVLVKNTNGSLAASCFTSAVGECQVSIGPDQYAISAVWKNDAGTVQPVVDESTATIVVKVKKMKAASAVPGAATQP